MSQLMTRTRIKFCGLTRPEDIAKAVVFLVTAGDYITGQVLQVDGGIVL